MEVMTMTITMTAKNQITIPRKVAKVLGLGKGTMFEVSVHANRIELVPLEVRRKEFGPEVYRKLDTLAAAEKGKEKKVTRSFIKTLKSGK